MSRKFWLLMVGLLALMLALEYQMPRRFQWEPTFAHADRQPFGCYVFDSVLSQTMPHGYTVGHQTLAQLAFSDTAPRSIVILTSGYQYKAVDVDTLLALAYRGCRILFATTSVRKELADTLHTDIVYHDFFSLKDFQRANVALDSICWTGDSDIYQPAVYCCYRKMVDGVLVNDDAARCDILARLGNHDIVAESFSLGKGELILVSTPLLLTNYGALNHTAYVHRLMNRLKELPVVRTEAYMPNYNVSESSPFRELLKRPPLRWALYLVLLGVVLLMGFNARRRQRAVPVEGEPKNYQLNFIRHIGTLHYLKQNKN